MNTSINCFYLKISIVFKNERTFRNQKSKRDFSVFTHRPVGWRGHHFNSSAKLKGIDASQNFAKNQREKNVKRKNK